MLQLNVKAIYGTRSSVVSDTTWQVAGGPITHNSLQEGEIYDGPGAAGMGRSRLRRRSVELRTRGGAATGRFLAAPPMKVIETRCPERLTTHLPERTSLTSGSSSAGGSHPTPQLHSVRSRDQGLCQFRARASVPLALYEEGIAGRHRRMTLSVDDKNKRTFSDRRVAQAVRRSAVSQPQPRPGFNSELAPRPQVDYATGGG